MRLLRIGLVALAFLLVVSPAKAAQKDVHVINTNNVQKPFGFSPGTQDVSGDGSTVAWINDTGTPHTATSDDGTSFNVAIGNDGGTSPAFTGATRDIPYHCSIHTYMTGTIHVTAVLAPPPTTTTTAKPITNPTVKPTTTTVKKATTTSSFDTSTTEFLDLSTTTSEESTTSTTEGQVAIKTKSSGSNGAALVVLILAIAGVLGGGGYALYRLRRP